MVSLSTRDAVIYEYLVETALVQPKGCEQKTIHAGKKTKTTFSVVRTNRIASDGDLYKTINP